MKKLIFYLLVLFLALGMCTASALSITDESGSYAYELLEDNTAKITAYLGSESELLIPSELDGHTVTCLDSYAFFGCKSLTSVTIPDSVTRIDKFTFGDCTALTSITIPNSVTAVSSNPFFRCTSLTDIIISADHPTLKLVDGVLFDTTQNRLICYPCVLQADSYTIPDETEIIEHFAFAKCDALTSVVIPDSVKQIGRNPFMECTALTNISVSADHPTLAIINGVLFDKSTNSLICYPCAFQDTHYTIPDNVKTIGANAFCCASALTSITIPASVSDIEFGAFQFCTSLAKVTIPDGVTSIKRNAFYHCISLRQITIPESVNEIGGDIFEDCTNLSVIVIPDSVAEKYCKDYGMTFTRTKTMNQFVLDNSPTENP